jgi:hypothetical protein
MSNYGSEHPKTGGGLSLLTLIMIIMIITVSVYSYGIDPQPAIDLLGTDFAGMIGLTAESAAQ